MLTKLPCLGKVSATLIIWCSHHSHDIYHFPSRLMLIAPKGWEPCPPIHHTTPLQLILKLGDIHHKGFLPFPCLAEPCPPHLDLHLYATAASCCWGHSMQLHPWHAQCSGNGEIFIIIITGSLVYGNSKVSWDMNWWWALILVCNSILPSSAKQPLSATDF